MGVVPFIGTALNSSLPGHTVHKVRLVQYERTGGVLKVILLLVAAAV
jgi:hypothetical protein